MTKRFKKKIRKASTEDNVAPLEWKNRCGCFQPLDDPSRFPIDSVVNSETDLASATGFISNVYKSERSSTWIR